MENVIGLIYFFNHLNISSRVLFGGVNTFEIMANVEKCPNQKIPKYLALKVLKKFGSAFGATK